jgi:hypothetical protein
MVHHCGKVAYSDGGQMLEVRPDSNIRMGFLDGPKVEPTDQMVLRRDDERPVRQVTNPVRKIRARPSSEVSSCENWKTKLRHIMVTHSEDFSKRAAAAAQPVEDSPIVTEDDHDVEAVTGNTSIIIILIDFQLFLRSPSRIYTWPESPCGPWKGASGASNARSQDNTGGCCFSFFPQRQIPLFV